MNNLRKKLKGNRLITKMASVKIMVACLVWLFILTFWGTVAQVNQGLFLAQKEFFHSWFFTIGGIIPLPGAQLIFWIMFFNLLCAAITHFIYKWSELGILIIHLGLLTYFAAAFVTFYNSQESNLTLAEGEGSNVSTDYHEWELSVWPDRQSNINEIAAYDASRLKNDTQLDFNELGFKVIVRSYFPNVQAYRTSLQMNTETFFNSSGIQRLEPFPLNKEPEKNFPGGTFEIQTIDGQHFPLLLYGGETKAASLKIGEKKYNFALRRKRYPLPFTLTLKDFTMAKHPGTDIARSYQSKVIIEHDGVSRDVLIYMNHPLRFKDFTLYQASYAIDSLGREFSTLAVVKNAGRLLPYIAAAVTFAGLLIHFLIQGLLKKI